LRRADDHHRQILFRPFVKPFTLRFSVLQRKLRRLLISVFGSEFPNPFKMSSSSFRQHFDMISMNEPVQRKAMFWTSYVRALKGTEDMRAEDSHTTQARRRPFSEMPDLFPRIHNDYLPTASTEDANARIRAPGYRYQPVSQETYGHSPRAIQPVERLTSSSRRSRY
jgi:hypothetical protein